jgi:hypothetical protein
MHTFTDTNCSCLAPILVDQVGHADRRTESSVYGYGRSYYEGYIG